MLEKVYAYVVPRALHARTIPSIIYISASFVSSYTLF